MIIIIIMIIMIFYYYNNLELLDSGATVYFPFYLGTGLYIYIDASSPRQPGDTARLTSPWMRGPQCMTFFYHMFGSNMGCVVMYIRIQAAEKLQPIWLRSKDQGDRWTQGKLNIKSNLMYQVT